MLEDRLMELRRLAVGQAHILVIVVLLVGRKIIGLLKFEWLKIAVSAVDRLLILKFDAELVQEVFHVHVAHIGLILEVRDFGKVSHVFFVVFVFQLRETCSQMMEFSIGVCNIDQDVVLLVTEVFESSFVVIVMMPVIVMLPVVVLLFVQLEHSKVFSSICEQILTGVREVAKDAGCEAIIVEVSEIDAEGLFADLESNLECAELKRVTARLARSAGNKLLLAGKCHITRIVVDLKHVVAAVLGGLEPAGVVAVRDGLGLNVD